MDKTTESTAPEPRAQRTLLTVVLLVGLAMSSLAGALASSSRAETQAQRLDVVVARVVADVQAGLESVVGVGTAVAVASTTGAGTVESVLPGQVLLDRAVRRLTLGGQLGSVAPGLTGVLILDRDSGGLVAGSPARVREAAADHDLTDDALSPTLLATARGGSAALTPPLLPLIGSADLAVVVPLYRTSSSLQPTATAATRQENVLGWVVTTVDARTLGARAARDAGIAAQVEITDVTTAERLPMVAGDPLDEPGPSRVVVLGVPGRTWEIRITTAPTLLTAAERALPALIIAVGLLLTAGGTFLVGLLSTQRSRALRDVRQATSNLALVNAELERSNTDLTEFAAVAAHDLKSPLTVVRGMAPLIQRRLPDDVDPLVTTMLEAITDGAGRMASLIEDLLAYASVGAAPLQMEEVDLNTLLEEALATMPLYLQQPERVQITPLPTIHADRRLLGQALANIIGNALKFVPEGTEPIVCVSATESGTDLLITVRDNGIGIAPAEREAVLQAFRRSSKTAEVEGSGLGLAIVGRVAFAHGGEVILGDSDLGGTSVTLRLPAHQASA